MVYNSDREDHSKIRREISNIEVRFNEKISVLDKRLGDIESRVLQEGKVCEKID